MCPRAARRRVSAASSSRIHSGGILRPEAAHHPELRKRIAGAGEGLRRLPRAELAAVPDGRRAERRGLARARERRGLRPPARRERALRIDVGTDGVGVMDQVYSHVLV